MREAGLEVDVQNSNNFLELNYVINRSEFKLFSTNQSIDFMWCKAVKGQISGNSKRDMFSQSYENTGRKAFLHFHGAGLQTLHRPGSAPCLFR